MLDDKRSLEKKIDRRSSFVVYWKACFDEPSEVLRIEAGDILEFSHNNFKGQRSLILGLKRMFAGTQLINKATKGPNIRFLVVGFFLAQLWREIIRRSDNGMGKLSA